MTPNARVVDPQSAVGDVHRDFKAKTQIGRFGFLPCHGCLLFRFLNCDVHAAFVMPHDSRATNRKHHAITWIRPHHRPWRERSRPAAPVLMPVGREQRHLVLRSSATAMGCSALIRNGTG